MILDCGWRLLTRQAPRYVARRSRCVLGGVKGLPVSVNHGQALLCLCHPSLNGVREESSARGLGLSFSRRPIEGEEYSFALRGVQRGFAPAFL